MIDDINICRNTARTTENNVVFLELDKGDDTDILYLPVLFSRQLHNFPSRQSHQQRTPGSEYDVEHLCSGSIVLTPTNIVFTLSLPTDIPGYSYDGYGFKDNCKTTSEIVVFSDIIEVVTGFRRYIAYEEHNTVCCCYALELLGGVDSVFFNCDETRVVLPSASDNKFMRKHDGKSAAVESVLPEWVKRVEELIGESIEVSLWQEGNSNCCDPHSEHGFDVKNITSSWEMLRENAVRQLWGHLGNVPHVRASDTSTNPRAALSTGASGPAEFEVERQCYFNDALAAYISLMHEEHSDRERIFLQCLSTNVPIPREEELADIPRTTPASMSLSLCNQMSKLDDPNCFNGRKANLLDEVMMLLAEEEMVARMKLGK